MFQPKVWWMSWDEENRLSATRDQYYATANIYDAAGNRAWKLGGEVNWMWNNGQGWQAYGDLNLRTWYQSDLVTITDQTMTKHYFIAGQRIASKLTESLQPEVAQALKDKPVTPLSGDIRDLPEATANRIARDFDCVGLEYSAFYPGETWIESLENLLNAPEQPAEYQVFFYHSDHLGSSSFITDINGDATQHLQYLPFGEDFVHQQNTAAYYTPYTFSGKERDVETSLSYFGARYYEAGLSIWLSVDPLSDKYPSLSAYNYCALNPVMLVDPDGREIVNGYEAYKDKQGQVDKMRHRLEAARESGDKKEIRAANADLRANRATVRGVDNYRKVDALISEFKAKNGSEFDRLNNLTLNGVTIDVVVGLRNADGPSVDGSSANGTTEFQYGSVQNVSSEGSEESILEPTSIRGNRINITLFRNGQRLSTLANELGNADFAVNNPVKALADILNKTEYWKKASELYSFDYSDYIMGRRDKPDASKY